MRISSKPSVSGSTSVVPSRTAATTPALPVLSPASPEDAVSVSSALQLLSIAKAEVAKVPEVRTEKVEALRSAIDSDRYNPDGEAVADGIVREHKPVQTAPDVGT